MHEGPVPAKSLGQMAFGPNNVLFVGDNDGAAIHALQIEDAGKPGGPININGIDAKVAQMLGVAVTDIALADMAVHPVSRNVYLTVRRGAGADMKWILLRVTASATNPIEEVSLDNMKHSTASIANVPASTAGGRNPRNSAITDIAFADGKVWVAGLSNEEFSSAFRQITYPFTSTLETTSLQIYHVAHQKSETQAPVMTFIPKQIDGKTYILAGYTCTPLVTFDVGTLKNGQKVVGRTVAELGAGNQPLDMISYTYGGTDVVLVANRSHAMMKLNAKDFATGAALTEPNQVGIPRTNVSERGAITQLADFDKDNVLVVQKSATGGFDLKTIAKSTF
jgi:hypothetical protein